MKLVTLTRSLVQRSRSASCDRNNIFERGRSWTNGFQPHLTQTFPI